MGNIRYQRTAHRITSAVNCRPLKPSPRSIGPAAPYPTGVHIPGIPPPAKFATEPHFLLVDEMQDRVHHLVTQIGGGRVRDFGWYAGGAKFRRDRLQWEGLDPA